jgi:hypothetical protein
MSIHPHIFHSPLRGGVGGSGSVGSQQLMGDEQSSQRPPDPTPMLRVDPPRKSQGRVKLSPSEPAPAGEIADQGHETNGERIPDNDEERTVIGAMDDKDCRGDSAGRKARECS